MRQESTLISHGQVYLNLHKNTTELMLLRSKASFSGIPLATYNESYDDYFLLMLPLLFVTSL